MVNIKMDGKSCLCEIDGSRREVVADLAIAIGNIYNSIKTIGGEEESLRFQLDLIRCLAPDSPTLAPCKGMVTINKK